MLDSISAIFEGAAAKYLTAVDADSVRSNQHEIGGLPRVGFKDYLGIPSAAEEFRYPCVMAYFSSDGEMELCHDVVTWYDSRRNIASRSPEYRLYYKDNSVTELIQPGDFFLVAKKRDNTLLLVFTPADSSVEYQLRHLFGLSDLADRFTAADMPERTLILPVKLLLEELGIQAIDESSAESDLDMLLDRFPDELPRTSEFSALAREVSDLDCVEDPDSALLGWMEREEALFRAYERHVVAERLREGFGADGDDVDEFISFSLSVQNRRKSRVGHAFENHLCAIFTSNGLQFERGGSTRVTENSAKPDFLFPGFDAYHNSAFPTDRLFLLGAKTTCKDRWRQVLSEGDRLKKKYLVTLEAGISAAQTAEMQDKGLQLIVPGPVHTSYFESQRKWLFDLREFIGCVSR